MGKKSRAKARTHRRPKYPAFASRGFSDSQWSNRNSDDGGKGLKRRGHCDHYKQDSVGLDVLLWEILNSSMDVACEACFVEICGRETEENCKQSEEKDAEITWDTILDSRVIWVCLDCERYFCGGAESDSEPNGHAHQHAMLEGHPWAAQYDDPDLVWCFECNSLIETLMPGESEEPVLMEKDEDVGCTGGVEPNKETDDGPKDLIIERRKAYVVRGLKNLGNTCFFNSVMQNILAMDPFRDYVLSSEWFVGPLAMEMKKLFLETTSAENSALNPYALFECICAKAPQFRGYQQQDSHELLRYLLDGLCTEEKIAASSVSSGGKDKTLANSGVTFVETIFGGKLCSTISCVECGHTSTIYEAFLDLSLPVPVKKLPIKNVPLAISKRNKRVGNGRERPGGEDVAEGSPVIKRQKAESFSPVSECNESSLPPLVQAVSLTVEEALMGIKYGPISVLEGADSASQMRNVSVTQYMEDGLFFQGENNSSCTSDSQTEICSKEKVTSLDFYGENLSSCIQDSDAIVLPYKKPDSTHTEINRMTQNQENVAFLPVTVKECSAQSTYACSRQVEVDLGVFANLFDEPEITSDCKTGTATREDANIILSTNSESNPNEVDDTGGPLSVESCLALFTKTEILSDEHAWHCEQCSGNSLLHNLGYQRSKSQAGASLDQSEALNSQVDGSEVRSKTASLSLEVDNEKIQLAPQNHVLNVERLVSAHTTLDISQNALDHTGILDNKTCKYGQAGKRKSSESLDPISADQTQCDVSQKDENFAESNYTSQYLSCPAAQENSSLRESQGNPQSDSCSMSDQIYVGCGRPAQPPASSCSRDHPETILQSSCDIDSFSEIIKIGKKGLQLPGKLNPTDDSRGHEIEPKSRKVKRDATIRVLISKAPTILTIHLKRFNQDVNGHFKKLRGHISFQEILDIRAYMDPRHVEKQCCYRLLGVVEHSGTMAGGHYIAYVRGERRQGKTENVGSPAWFRASDDQVREVCVSEVLQSEAYILFYEIA